MTDTVMYEWVVEEIEGPDDDIVDCDYWPENQRAKAEALYDALIREGKRADFGLCRRQHDDTEEETDRQYLYRKADGSWPGRVMEGGATLPVRIKL